MHVLTYLKSLVQTSLAFFYHRLTIESHRTKAYILLWSYYQRAGRFDCFYPLHANGISIHC